MALADIGEDTIAVCTQCDYAANLEKAVSRRAGSDPEALGEEIPQPLKVQTPGARTIDEVAAFMQASPKEIIKTLIYIADGKAVAVVLRGDHEVNEIKLKQVLGVETLILADAVSTAQATGAPTGYVGPIGLSIPLVVDTDVLQMSEGIVGAGVADHHLCHVVPGRDFPTTHTGDLRNVVEWDRCSACEGGILRFLKGIEIGHVFKLGTKYSEAMSATYLDPQGKAQPYIMGCYGIGVSRLLSALVEEHHDNRGIVWPLEVAPFAVHLIPVSVKDDTQREVAELLYARFRQAGVEVLLDDREERAGVKFNDADLIGIPLCIVIGKHAGEGNVEFVWRADGEKQLMSAGDSYTHAMNRLRRE